MSHFIDCDSISCQFWLFSLGSGCSGTELGVAVAGTRPHPILFHPVFVFLLPPGLLGGFPLSAGPLHLLPGFLHGRLVRSTQDPPVHCPGEGHPCSGLSGKWGVLKFIENLFLFTSEYVQINWRRHYCTRNLPKVLLNVLILDPELPLSPSLWLPGLSQTLLILCPRSWV